MQSFFQTLPLVLLSLGLTFMGLGRGVTGLSTASSLFTAYDCSRPTDIMDVTNVARRCGKGTVKVQGYRNATIQVVQRQETISAEGWRCRATLNEDAFYCGK